MKETNADYRKRIRFDPDGRMRNLLAIRDSARDQRNSARKNAKKHFWLLYFCLKMREAIQILLKTKDRSHSLQRGTAGFDENTRLSSKIHVGCQTRN
jgi:hypothetical protein